MKCGQCGSLVIDGKCSDCGITIGSKYKSSVQNSVCKICGNNKMKGRLIKINHGTRNEREECYCYYCWTDEQSRRFHVVAHSYSTKEEAEYHKSIVENYNIPKFYGIEPNWKMVQKARDKVLNITF